jgi:hypothetical protein
MSRSTTAGGYGHEHQQFRRRVAQAVALGGAVCARCGLPIRPGEEWHLDHDDEDRGRYLGPSHARCNVSAAGRKAGGSAAVTNWSQAAPVRRCKTIPSAACSTGHPMMWGGRCGTGRGSGLRWRDESGEPLPEFRHLFEG